MNAASPFAVAKRIHQDIIDCILSDWPQASTRRFMAALKDLPDAEYVPCLLKCDPEWAYGVNFIPDAWLIDTEKRHVVMFEAVHNHDVPEKKFAKMADLSWALDEDYYKLVLVRCDRFSRVAYDVQAASKCSELEMLLADEPSQGWHVPDWQKYNARYCHEFFKKCEAV